MIDLPEGELAEPVTLTLDIHHTVRGRIVWSGSGLPVPGVSVGVSFDVEDASARADAQSVGQADPTQLRVERAYVGSAEKTGDDGVFTIENVPNGPLEFRFGTHATTDQHVKGKELRGEEVLDVGDLALVAAVTLRFRLVDAQTGAPYVGKGFDKEVVAEAQSQSSNNPDGIWYGSAIPGDDPGVYVLRSVPSDLQHLTLTPPGGEPLNVDSVPPPDAQGMVNLGDRKVTRKAGGAAK